MDIQAGQKNFGATANVNVVNRIYQQLSQFVDKQFVNNNFAVCVSLEIFRNIRCEISPNKVRCSHELDYHRLSEYESKKPLQSNDQIRAAVFWHLQAFDYSKVSPLKQDLSKSRCTVGLNYEQRFCDLWRYLMSLRALSGEHETKKLLQSNCQIRTAVF